MDNRGNLNSRNMEQQEKNATFMPRHWQNNSDRSATGADPGRMYEGHRAEYALLVAQQYKQYILVSWNNKTNSLSRTNV